LPQSSEEGLIKSEDVYLSPAGAGADARHVTENKYNYGNADNLASFVGSYIF